MYDLYNRYGNYFAYAASVLALYSTMRVGWFYLSVMFVLLSFISGLRVAETYGVVSES